MAKNKSFFGGDSIPFNACMHKKRRRYVELYMILIKSNEGKDFGWISRR